MPDSCLDRVLANIDTACDRQQLATFILKDQVRAKAFGITPENVAEIVAARSHIFRSIYPAFSEFCTQTLQLPPHQLLGTLWDLWLPLAMQIASARQKKI